MAGDSSSEPFRDPDSTVVLGVDPGTGVTGYGVVARSRAGAVSLLECGVVRTSSDDPLPLRIREIHQGIREVIERYRPTAMCVEDVYQGRNARTALILGHSRGAILLAGSLSDLSVSEYTAPEIKKAVAGNGRATKDQVAFMVQKLLRLESPPQPDDAADGVAAALCHCLQEGIRT